MCDHILISMHRHSSVWLWDLYSVVISKNFNKGSSRCNHAHILGVTYNTRQKILNITILFSTIDYPIIDKRIASITLIENSQYQTILAKSPGTLCIFLIWTEHSPPPPPKQCWLLREVHVVTEKFFVLLQVL